MKNKILLSSIALLTSTNAMASSDIPERHIKDLSMSEPFSYEEKNELITPYVTNGSNASISNYPYYSRLILTDYATGYKHLCGGSILNNQYILTAAHCVDSDVIDGSSTTIESLGIVINNGNYSGIKLSEIKEVSKIYIHSGYNNSSMENDIAVLKLKNPITETFNAITIPSSSDVSYYNGLSTMRVIGMGFTTNYNTSPSSLQQADVNFEDDTSCNSLTNSIYGTPFSASKQICALPISGADSCQGDSGGPLTYYDSADGKYYQAGLVSYGSALGCGVSGYPSVYTEVAGYSSWLSDVFAGNIPAENYESGSSDGDSGGGSLGLFSLFGMLLAIVIRRKEKN